SSQPAVRPRPHPTVPKPKTITESPVIASNVLVGGFDDEGLDDAIERDTAMQAVGKVYGIQQSIEIISGSESEGDLAELTSMEQALLEMHGRSIGPAAKVAKRKVDELEVSETSFSDDETAMQVDSPIPEKEQSVRKTTSTSATITTGSRSVTVPPVKKLKKEPSELSLASVGSSIPPSQPPSLFATMTRSASGAQEVIKPRHQYRNSDLPVPADSKWVKPFLNTAILWAGSQDNLWEISELQMADALQEIFDVVYLDVPYKVTTNGAVFAIVSSIIGSHKLLPSRFCI
ncbi:hypothetical protein AZE42_13585, partial [Rhizopogon vesiculosus]